MANLDDAEYSRSFRLLDHRSTSSSPDDDRSDNEGPSSFVQAHMAKYIDFDSPILKHLIDIENKFWNSKVNQAFKLPKKTKSIDSESSCQSLAGVTSYNLALQNKKRPESAIIKVAAFSETRTASNFFKTEAKSCDSKGTKHAHRDSSGDNEANRFLSSHISDKQAKHSGDQLAVKVAAKLKIKDVCRKAAEKATRIDDRQASPKIDATKVQKLMVKHSFLNSKANSPGRNKSNPKESSKKTTLRDSTRKGLRKREGIALDRLDTFEKSKNSYLRLDTSEIDPSKLFVKRFHHIFSKTPGTSLSKDRKERHFRRQDETAKKSRIDTTSNSKMIGKLSLANATAAKMAKVKLSSREMIGKIGSEFLSKQRKALHRGRLDAEGAGSGGHSQLLTSKFINSHLMQTPKDTKTSLEGYFKTRNQLLTFSHSKPISSKSKKTKKSSCRDSSTSRNGKKRQKTSLLGASRHHLQTFGHLAIDRPPKQTSRRGLVEGVRFIDMEKQMITANLKSKIWSRIMAKRS